MNCSRSSSCLKKACRLYKALSSSLSLNSCRKCSAKSFFSSDSRTKALAIPISVLTSINLSIRLKTNLFKLKVYFSLNLVKLTISHREDRF